MIKNEMIEKAKIISVDFDGCLVENRFPEIGEANRDLFNLLIKRKKEGAAVILFSCRTGILLDEAVEFCESEGLIFDEVNANLKSCIEYMHGDTRKIYADVYIDDKAVCEIAGTKKNSKNR